MLVVLSADMEGVSQLRRAREILAACPEYWETGKPRYEAEVAAACEGLLAGGATEVVVLDNHASGNPANIGAGALPAGARLEAWNVWDLPGHGVDAMLQVGYHARGGVDRFLSHTYGFDLRLRCGDELISESHGRAWAAQTRLIGITGNDLHEQTLGSLSGTPFLVVQRSFRHGAAEPVVGLDAVREFARTCAENASDVPRSPRRALLRSPRACRTEPRSRRRCERPVSSPEPARRSTRSSSARGRTPASLSE
jgi:hypothetical protein